MATNVENKHQVGDDQVVITICFCDENCSTYNLVKAHENNKKEEVKSFQGKRGRQFQQRLHQAKRKVVDCRQVRIPASINVVSDNLNSKRFKNSFNKINNDEPKSVYRANGMQVSDGVQGKLQPQHKTDYTDLTNSLTSPDMFVSINGTEFRCSSQLLKKYSGFFRDLEIDNTCKIFLCGICISEEAFSTIYTWMQMYIREPGRIINEDNIVDLLNACLFLILSDLEIKCWELICNPSVYKGEKAFKIYKRSIDKNFYQITETVFDRVIKYFPVLINTNGFLNSELDHIMPVLSSDEIFCNSEMEVFLAVSKWILHDLDNRWKHLPELVDTVRFGLMPSEQLCCLHMAEVSNNIRMITSHPHTSKKIENGIVLNSLKAEFNYPNESSNGFWFKCRELGVEVPKERTRPDLHLQICVCHNKK